MKTDKYRIVWKYIPHTRAIGCIIDTLDGIDLGGACAFCSENDLFCKDTGRKISLARALKQAKIPLEERVVIWEKYRIMTKKPRWSRSTPNKRLCPADYDVSTSRD